MFCEKCGAQLPDTARFCNKCGNVLRQHGNKVQAPAAKVNNIALDRKKNTSVSEKKGRGAVGIGCLLAAVIVIVAAAVAFFTVEEKTDIYGTWTDAHKTVTLTFNKDGNLRVSGAKNILGADAFQFTQEKGVLHLRGTGLAGIEFDSEYEIADNALHISFRGHEMTFYRADEVSELDGSDLDSSDSEDTGEALADWAEEALDTVQIYFLYGTWTDSQGIVSLTFNEDGTLHVSGLADILPAEAFAFSEVDDDTLQLKVNSDNPLGGSISLNMDYEIEGDSMTVTILGRGLKLVKKE